MLEGRLAVWRGLLIADATRILRADAAAYVDEHLARFVHGGTWPQVDKLAEEALVRFDPEAAEQRREASRDRRHVDTGLDTVGYDGVAHISADVDVADATSLHPVVAITG